jgi:hypothetical protein
MLEILFFGITCYLGFKVFCWVVDNMANIIAGSAKFIAFAFMGAIFWAILTGTEVIGTVQMMIDNVQNIVNQ